MGRASGVFAQRSGASYPAHLRSRALAAVDHPFIPFHEMGSDLNMLDKRTTSSATADA